MKEGFILSENHSIDDPYVIAGKFGQGPNKYPQEVSDPDLFKKTVEEYHAAMTRLASQILQVIARTLNIPDDFFVDFSRHPVSLVRLLHYPPQGPRSSELERGKLMKRNVMNGRRLT